MIYKSLKRSFVSLNRLVVIYLETDGLCAKKRLNIPMFFCNENGGRILELNTKDLTCINAEME